MFLIGEYKVAVGDKNRIALPKKIRSQLGGQIIITRGYEGCALIMDHKLWRNFIAQVDKESLFKLTVRDTKRYLLGSASEVELDAQGRFVFPDYLGRHIAMQQDVVFVGLGDLVEVWSAEKWQEKVTYLAENAADIADKLANQND